METIEERAREYAHQYRRDAHDLKGERADAAFAAYCQGAKSEREELTRWHDPKEELPPIYDNVMVKYMALDGCEHVAIAWRSAGDAGGCTYTISGTGVAINSRNVIGWREIHE
jgi:hypothetical protein